MAPDPSGRGIELKAYDEAVHRAVEHYLERPNDALTLWSHSVHTSLRGTVRNEDYMHRSHSQVKPCIYLRKIHL